MNNIVGDIAVEYCINFPGTATLTLAKKIHSENSGVFESVEHARRVLRYYRGAAGNRQRKTINKNKLFPRVTIPDGDDIQYEPFIIPDELTSGLMLNDIHIPYHSKQGLESALEFGYVRGCDFILLNGDIIDFYQISNFLKDPRKRHIKEEISMLGEFLDYLIREFNGIKIFYKFGNHEERWDSYLMRNAAELYDLDAVRLEVILGLEEKGITIIRDKRVIKYRHLSALHGHEYRFSISNPVNPARGIFLRTHHSTIAGHFHQTSEHSEPTIGGDLITCWSTGCLCGLHPEYMPLNKWNHGFGWLRGMEDEYWRVENKKIIDGKIV